MFKKIGLIGLGAIGIPIADKLYSYNCSDFFIIANDERKKKLLSRKLYVNDKEFNPNIISDLNDLNDTLDLLIVCVKNYDLKNSIKDFKCIISDNTIVLPLQNGIYAYDFFTNEFPNNIVLQGYAQGPNTKIIGDNFYYQNSGEVHIGSKNHLEIAKEIYMYLKKSGVDIYYEDDIQHMIWKKLMLNIAGNSVTALTGTDYSMFKYFPEAQELCTSAMIEFQEIAKLEGILLTDKDIQDIINYYVNYNGKKKTSMLVDVLNERKTENDYLAGQAIKIANKHNITIPIISTLYHLLEIKEAVYMDKKGVIMMKNLFREGVEYGNTLRMHMEDIDKKMSDREYAIGVNNQCVPQLNEILRYAIENTSFYAHLGSIKNLKITDFPVMNKTLLNNNYDDILVHSFDEKQTHKMHTSGSTGIPFTVVQNLDKRERHIADLKYFGALAGYLDKDPMCYLRAKPTATKEDQERDRIYQLDICNLNENNLTDYYNVMIEKKCTALIAYPSTLETAVDFWSTHFNNDSLIQTIISTSETLTDEVKAKLKNYFGEDVGVYARYSNTENGILGQETGESGVYCLNWASYYFEILKLESDEPAEEGELGRIVVTDFYNKAFPMIRYDTGDVAKMRKFSDDKLPVFEELFGRRMDLIYDTSGEVVSPFLLCRTMRLSNGIEQWQFIQETETEYILKITTTDGTKPSCSKEIESFKKTLGENASITIEYVESIPVMNSLMRKLIVSNLK